jgi:hypothetical protein
MAKLVLEIHSSNMQLALTYVITKSKKILELHFVKLRVFARVYSKEF